MNARGEFFMASVRVESDSVGKVDVPADKLMLVTALAPVIGYDKASEIAHHASETDLTLKEATLELGFVVEGTFDSGVDPAKMVKRYVAAT
jgi:fumarate hydratase class II